MVRDERPAMVFFLRQNCRVGGAERNKIFLKGKPEPHINYKNSAYCHAIP